MSHSDELKSKISKLFLQQLFAVLSTQGPDGPHSVIVCFLVTSGLGELFFVTPRSTRKFNHMISRPVVALFMDNRQNSLQDLHGLTGVEVIGRAEVAPEDDRVFMRDLFLKRFPELEEFYDSPDCALIKVRISRFNLVSDIQKTESLEII